MRDMTPISCTAYAECERRGNRPPEVTQKIDSQLVLQLTGSSGRYIILKF